MVKKERVFSNSEISARRFNIDSVAYKARTITLVSIESEKKFNANEQIIPADWKAQLTKQIEAARVIFVPYFIPELERTVYKSKAWGWLAKIVSEEYHQVYRAVAEVAAEKKIPVAVSDIANKNAYLIYERTPQEAIALGFDKSAGSIEISKSEKFIPFAVDARRMFTAKGIMQEAERYPEGSNMVYIAAPAHINRVKEYITKKPSRLDALRYRIYKNSFSELDKSTRIYKPTAKGWLLVSNERIK